jgi:hypothetical protein
VACKTHFYCAFLQHQQIPVALPPRLLHRGAIKLVVAPIRNLCPLARSRIISPLASLRKVSSLLPFV